ncbi:chlorophyll a/b-binding protein domain-containing protein [Pelagophyceae sp. CCMP2097]|nr:chlorophyll a/b-binding protein domain-containing protein [Pelagophyceae sp. CCMP2097]
MASPTEVTGTSQRGIAAAARGGVGRKALLLACFAGIQQAGSVATETRSRRRSDALPWIDAPSAPWLDGSAVGDFGFDPLGLASSPALLSYYREAEMKHSRLAMLAAIGWPVSELLDQPIADLFHVAPKLQHGLAQSVLDRGLAPSLLNGGLTCINPLFWGFALGTAGAFELYALKGMIMSSSVPKESSKLKEYKFVEASTEPGDLAFDPLGFFPTERLRRRRMCLAELKHGRIAMMAISGYAAEEFILGSPVVEHSAAFFRPVWSVFF